MHKQTNHSEITSPVSKRIKIKEGEGYNEENLEDGDEKMDVDDDLESRSQKNDEKVKLKQRMFDEEEEKRVKEMKRKEELVSDK